MNAETWLRGYPCVPCCCSPCCPAGLRPGGSRSHPRPDRPRHRSPPGWPWRVACSRLQPPPWSCYQPPVLPPWLPSPPLHHYLKESNIVEECKHKNTKYVFFCESGSNRKIIDRYTMSNFSLPNRYFLHNKKKKVSKIWIFFFTFCIE